MKRVTLYSSSPRARPAAPAAEAAPRDETPAPAVKPARGERHAAFERVLLVAAGGLVALAVVLAHSALAPPARPLTQQDIDAAVLNTLETKPLPSPYAKAYENIRPSIVRVQGMVSVEPTSDDVEHAVGSGVVIVDNGTILTNLHVVTGADRIKVTFYDGMESEATIVGLKPEHDLAVLKAKSVPDDLVAATLRSTGDLLVGDHVVAVGFPFGIGPSASAGVVSGLRREFQSPEGKRLLTNLIQFDAAANPGSSGGPLVTADGEVVGIVTAILNPSEQRVFIGIGFAVPIENAASAVGMHPF
jgi:S1-C subfamily serine protease